MDPVVEAGIGYAVGGGAQIAEMVYVTYAENHGKRLDRAKVLLGIEATMTLAAAALIYFGLKENDMSMARVGFGLIVSRLNWLGLAETKIL